MKSKKILLIDNLVDANAIKSRLEQDSYVITIAKNGEEALKEFDKKNFDLIIIEIKLPDIYGIELSKDIREIDPVTPIIFYTSLFVFVDKVLCSKIGINDYIEKAPNHNVLLGRIESLLLQTQRHS